MSNKYLYIGNKLWKGPLGMEKPDFTRTSWLGGATASMLYQKNLDVWHSHIDSLPSIPYSGKEDDFKVDQICEEGKEIRVGYQMKLNTDWIDATMWIYGHTADTSKRTVILPNTPVVSEKPFVSASCEGELCSVCGKPATAKAGEEILYDDPNPIRHGLTAFLCSEHFDMVFRPYLVSQSKEKDNVPSYSEEEVKEIIRYCAEKGYYTWASSGNIFEACNDDISTTPSEILLNWKKQKEESK